MTRAQASLLAQDSNLPGCDGVPMPDPHAWQSQATLRMQLMLLPSKLPSELKLLTVLLTLSLALASQDKCLARHA